MKNNILEITGRKEFVCLGSECPRDCCHGWRGIVVDADTLKKWDETRDPKAKQHLLSFINTRDDGVSEMNMSNENVCMAINDEKLCSIQLQHGHEYLSETCRSFPRIGFYNYYRSYESVSFSCPAIVETILFSKNNKPLFQESDNNKQNSQTADAYERLLYTLDILLGDILDKPEYPIGIIMFFVSDIFSEIIRISQTNNLTENTIQQIRVNMDTYLSNISKSVKSNKLTTSPVSSGSFWKYVYKLCESRNVDTRFLDDSSANLVKAINQCDDSFASYGKIYAIVKQYRKLSNKQIKQKYVPMFRKYIKILFINKGFPLSPKHSHDLVLVDCMINICVLQLLIWIEVNKNKKLSDNFIKECIVEVDRKFVLHDGVILGLEENPHMVKIEKYCNTFLDLF